MKLSSQSFTTILQVLGARKDRLEDLLILAGENKFESAWCTNEIEDIQAAIEELTNDN